MAVMEPAPLESWTSGDAYEQFMGRWSRLVAREFVAWLGVEAGSRWLDIGCGSGALTRTALELASPAAVLGVEPSAGYASSALRLTADGRARFTQGDACSLPCRTGAFDAIVSGLVLNFVPDTAQALAEMRRALRPGGVVAAYVWDYAEGMQMLRYFWDAAAFVDPEGAPHDEGERFPICRPDSLADAFRSAGFDEVAVHPLVVATTFRDFDDFWDPFLGGQGAAPAYVSRLTEAQRSALRDRLAAALPKSPGSAIHLTARAWAARGRAAPGRTESAAR
jgi:SAM-dependent methyltransferase